MDRGNMDRMGAALGEAAHPSESPNAETIGRPVILDERRERLAEKEARRAELERLQAEEDRLRQEMMADLRGGR